MPFLIDHRSFLLNRPLATDSGGILAAAAAYAVQLHPAVAQSGQLCWRVLGVVHLSPQENQGKHAVYVDVVDTAGNRVRDPNLRLRWGWQDQHADEQVDPKAFDKPDDEPASNVDLFLGMKLWVQVEGDGLSSDRVANLHSQHPDEVGPSGEIWNSLGHHSFYILFQQRMVGEQKTGTEPPLEPLKPPVQPPPPQPPIQPQPDNPLPQPASQGNKLGFYLHMSTDQNGLWDAIQRTRPPVILFHADSANNMLLDEIRRWRAPDAFVVGRIYKDLHVQRQILESDDPEGQGRAFAEEILNYDFGLATRRNPQGRLLIDAWMSLNEALPGPASQAFRENEAEVRQLLANYDRFQVAFRRKLQEAGVEAIAFNFAAGNFSEPAHYLDFFPATLSETVYLGFHEYGWPTLYPDPASATAAGIYRRCMDGIRARYGDRHRVIISEAGLTRAYQNPAWGDVGWLNHEAPLSEDQTWQSLNWYNNHLNQDDYVVGACLFEVGHHGNWESFRHLGHDNQGNPLHLIDRIAALNAAQPPNVQMANALLATVPAATSRSKSSQQITLAGRVTLTGKSLTGAVVRLFGGQDTLGTVRQAASAAATSLAWTRRLSGLRGSAAQVWRKQLAGKLAGLTQAEFVASVAQYNPSLTISKGRFDPELSYYLPQNVDPATVVWDRSLADFSGTLWQCWQAYVQHKVIGLNFADFAKQMRKANPGLKRNEKLQSNHRYNLPRNAGQKEYTLVTISGRGGRFQFEQLPVGDYRLEVQAEGAQAYRESLIGNESASLIVALQSLAQPAPLSRALAQAASGTLGDGFVGVAGDQFAVNGERFRFIGVNIRGLVHYGDQATLQHPQEGHKVEQLNAARDMGVRVVRVFLPSTKVSTAETINRLRALCDLMRHNFPGMYLIPALHNLYGDVNFRVAGDERFYQQLDPNFHIDLLNAEFFNRGYTQNYLPFVRQVVSALRDDPVIFAWELGNELKLDASPAAFVAFNLKVASEIRRLDPNHLITTGMISTRHASLNDDEIRRRLYGVPIIDFITVHCYNNEYDNDDSELARQLRKPFIIEEAGYGNNFSQNVGFNRSGLVNDDLNRWFAREARGYMPWGFMATQFDINDGDGDSGLDRVLHQDWDALFSLYRDWASRLRREDAGQMLNAKPPVSPDNPLDPGSGLRNGQPVFAQDWVNVRRSAGYRNKLGDDILGRMAAGSAATITGISKTVDELTWWPVQTTLSNGQYVNGWAAEKVNEIVLLATTAPAGTRSLGGTVAQAVSRTVQRARSRSLGGLAAGGIAYTQAYINLRRSPGYVQKPSDDVIGQIPYGASIDMLEGPIAGDGLSWWHVRGPLLDNSVADGWAAVVDPAGQMLIGLQTPPTPSAPSGEVVGQAFKVGDTLIVVAVSANLRRSAGYQNQPPDHVLAIAPNGTVLTISGGAQNVDNLEWWQVRGTVNGQPVNGWVATVDPAGTRLVAPGQNGGGLHIPRPFADRWSLMQGFGENPQFYGSITYDGVPLLGHNGLDFGTPVGTPLLAVAPGQVSKVDFEPGGFGHHILIRHSWGESLYAHLDRVDLPVGASVIHGTPIGLSGASGLGTGPHLHFGIRLFPYRRTDGWGGFVNPAQFMDAADLIATRSLHRLAPMATELVGRMRP